MSVKVSSPEFDTNESSKTVTCTPTARGVAGQLPKKEPRDGGAYRNHEDDTEAGSDRHAERVSNRLSTLSDRYTAASELLDDCDSESGYWPKSCTTDTVSTRSVLCSDIRARSALSACAEIDEVIQSLVSSNVGVYLNKQAVERLVFLRNTVDLLAKYLGEQSEEMWDIPEFTAQVHALSVQLEDTVRMMRRVRQGACLVTDNFDIFELTLRKYLEQFQRMFSAARAFANPSTVIEDAEARSLWERYIGASVFFVDFETFVERALTPEIRMKFGFTDHDSARSPESKLGRMLQFFLNFPRDDMITTYKWNLLLRQFGPYNQFADNFASIVGGRGFVGLVNRIKAREILSMDGHGASFLIRFSRTEPDFLAFSYKTRSGAIAHHLNRDRHGRAVPVAEFVRLKFAKFVPVNQRVDVDSILGASNENSLCEYASYESGYIVAEG